MPIPSDVCFAALKREFDAKVRLSASTWHELAKQVEEIKVSTTEVLHEQGDISRWIYFLTEGVAKEFVQGKASAVNRAFYMAPSLIGSQYNFRNNSRHHSSVAMVGSGKVFRIECEKFERLLQAREDLNRWYALTMSHVCLQQQQRLRALLQKGQDERLEDFCQEYAQLVTALPAEDIASYLDLPQIVVSIVKRKLRLEQSTLQLSA